MDVMNLERWRDAANEDAEFRLAARFWSSALRFDMGDAACLLTVEDGRIDRIEELDPAARRRSAWRISIVAPADEWNRLLSPLPPPFYQDLWGATNRHGFEVGGDLEEFCQYYPAIARLLETLRAVVNAA